MIFDWGGTLTPWHTVDLIAQWQVYAEHYTRDHADFPDGGADLAARMLVAERESWDRLKREGTSARLADVFAAVGISTDHPGHPAAQSAYEEFWEPHTYIDPDVPVLFTALRERGVRVGVLSNTIWSRDYHRRVFERDGILPLIDGDVYTSEIPWVKPHPEAFGAAMSAVGMSDPARCVYVGDRLFDDVWGAQNAGLRAIHVPHSDIPPTQVGHSEGTPDAVVHRLSEIADVVAGWA